MCLRIRIALLCVLAGCGRNPHPNDFATPSVHGPEANLQLQTCTSCHGEDLKGERNNGVSCDSCHQKDWRDNCTYCHGGDDSDDGAPPRYIDGSSREGSIAFAAHAEHGSGADHAALGCEQCHAVPKNVLTPGHIFVGDATSSRAEVDFTNSLGAASTWDGSSCSDSYCHGNGQGDNGKIKVDKENLGCGGCHAGPATLDKWGDLSGRHTKHLFEGLACEDCHGKTVTGNEISSPAKHVDGRVALLFPEGFDGSHTTCSGRCHGEGHNNEDWN